MRVRPVLSLCVATAMLCCFASFATAQVPSSIAGLELWLDASDASTITTAGGLVTQWSDKSGNSFHATPTAGGSEPTVGVGVLGGQNAIRFSTAGGTPDGMIINSPAGQFNRGYTIFTVDQYQSITGTSHERTLQSQDINWLTGKWRGTDGHFANGWVSREAPASTSIGEALGGTGPGSSAYHVNGFNKTGLLGAASPTGAPGRLAIARGGAFAEFSDADVAEVIAYDRVLNYQERQQVGVYLESKYGLGTFYSARVNNTVTTAQFTGAGDLDFSGVFLHAVDFGGSGNKTVGDATFEGTQTGLTTGVTFSAPNTLIPGQWGNVEYGADANNNNLETVMESIRWNTGNVTVDLPGLTVGDDYRLQLLFAENCCNRGFQVELENSLLEAGFSPRVVQGVLNNSTAGASITYDFFATDAVANLRLLSQGGFADNNPIINGLTLEAFPDPEATFSTPDGGTIDFSADLVIGPNMDTQTLTIENTGEVDSVLVLNDALLSGDAEFSLLNFTPGTTLAQGEMIDLLIKFDGSDALPGDTFSGLLEIDTNVGTNFGDLNGQVFSFNLNALVTPEPASLALWSLLGLAAMAWWRTKGRKSA